VEESWGGDRGPHSPDMKKKKKKKGGNGPYGKNPWVEGRGDMCQTILNLGDVRSVAFFKNKTGPYNPHHFWEGERNKEQKAKMGLGSKKGGKKKKEANKESYSTTRQLVKADTFKKKGEKNNCVESPGLSSGKKRACVTY